MSKSYHVPDDEIIAARTYRRIIEQVADETGLPVALFLGIGSRESRMGLALSPANPGGTGDFIRRPRSPWAGADGLPVDGRGGWGRGIWQIDYAAHSFARTGPWYRPMDNLRYSALVLKNAQKYVRSLFPEAEPLSILALMLAETHASVAAYNTGPGNVRKSLERGLTPDRTTHGGDYSRDVLRRVRAFVQQVKWADPDGFLDAVLEPMDTVENPVPELSALVDQSGTVQGLDLDVNKLGKNTMSGEG